MLLLKQWIKMRYYLGSCSWYYQKFSGSPGGRRRETDVLFLDGGRRVSGFALTSMLLIALFLTLLCILMQINNYKLIFNFGLRTRLPVVGMWEQVWGGYDLNNQQKYIIISRRSMQCPTHKSKLTAIPIEDQSHKACSVCGRQSSLRCSSCKFVLCSQCRICNQEHNLVKIIELSKVKPEYYNNGYSCNSCSKSKVVSDNGIWHCNQCNYDICEECAQ